MTRGAGTHVAPLTYEGEWDADHWYLPRQIVTRNGRAYMAVARSTNIDPETDAATWLKLGSSGVYLDTIIKQGPVGVATNVFPAGTRVPTAFTTTFIYARCDPAHAPTGGPCTVVVKRGGTTIATVSIAAGATSGATTVAVLLNAGDLLAYDITAAGSTTPAWSVAVGIEGG